MKAQVRKQVPAKTIKTKGSGQKEVNPNSIMLPSLEKVIENVNKTVIAQEDVVKSVCTKVYEGILFPTLKSNILIVGKSGTGKTEIIRQISENIGVPFSIEDCSQFTESGYVGESVDSIIKNLIRAADNNVILAQKGIVFLDEIDKKIANSTTTDFVNKEGVLKELLKMIEGKKVFVEIPSKIAFEPPQKVSFDTSKVIFIMGGAFSGLSEIREKRLKDKKKLGFTVEEKTQKVKPKEYLKTSFSKRDLKEFGMPEEFLGRIASIYETKELNGDDLEKILKISKKSPFKNYESIIQCFDKKLIYPKNLLKNIAIQAKNVSKDSTGARELFSITSYMFEKIMYDLLTKDLSKYHECVLRNSIVHDNTQYFWR